MRSRIDRSGWSDLLRVETGRWERETDLGRLQESLVEFGECMEFAGNAPFEARERLVAYARRRGVPLGRPAGPGPDSLFAAGAGRRGGPA